MTDDRVGVIPLLNVEVMSVGSDGEIVWKLHCPGCGVWGELDDDQWNGRVSILCGECGWHKTVNLKAVLDARVALGA